MSTLLGVTVVEVGGFLAAPWATMHLADLGARVIKIETPGQGDSVRATAPMVNGESAAFASINRNKESVALDLKSPDGLAAFRELVTQADVLVENLRPGAMSKLGLGYADLAAEAPSLIYASASGWGQDGPDAGLPGLDIMAQARSGLMSITGPVDEVADAILSVPVPTIAAVAGYCVGGGFLISAACDLRIAAENAKFGAPMARTLGNCLSQHSYRLVVELLGRSTTLDLLLRARRSTPPKPTSAGSPRRSAPWTISSRPSNQNSNDSRTTRR